MSYRLPNLHRFVEETFDQAPLLVKGSQRADCNLRIPLVITPARGDGSGVVVLQIRSGETQPPQHAGRLAVSDPKMYPAGNKQGFSPGASFQLVAFECAELHRQKDQYRPEISRKENSVANMPDMFVTSSKLHHSWLDRSCMCRWSYRCGWGSRRLPGIRIARSDRSDPSFPDLSGNAHRARVW